MAAAIRLAHRHIGQTADNPSVGALIVRNDGQRSYIVGRGVTARGGRPHAEVIALIDASDLSQDATVYVTLEPCSHYGQTPPCTDALISSGVARVVVAACDPDPRVNGKGITQLRQAGIEVVEHILTDMAEESLGPYLCIRKMQRPEVTLKLAISADGFIGRIDRGNILVSGVVSQAQAHILRAENDAILVGIGTAVTDDPMLDCRLPSLEKRSPIRIILDSWLRLPLNSRIVKTAAQAPVWVICDADASAGNIEALRAAGCSVFFCRTQAGRIDLQNLLFLLGQAGINSLLVEGGAQIACSFWNANLVDRLILFQSPVIIGHEAGYEAPDFGHKIQEYQQVRCQQFGEDFCQEWKKVM
ncbi:MAG: Pyrimidine deaminase [Candidatus Tokpelaia sp. JSC085]|nr:MAG: Pyrimidine deaminase [Candidatus Tokpelaia sp. JSC085]